MVTLELDDNSIEKIMKLISFDLENAIKEKLTPERGKFTGRLKSSVRAVPKGNEIHLFMEDYAKYIEYGIAHNVQADDLILWVETKILKRKGNSKKDKAQTRRIAENIAEHIRLFGPRPYPFIRTTLKQDLPKIIKNNFK